MKVKEMSVFRERGLRGVCRAEPQCLVSNLNTEWKADTMKPYILGKFPAVESQKSSAPPMRASDREMSITSSANPEGSEKFRKSELGFA